MFMIEYRDRAIRNFHVSDFRPYIVGENEEMDPSQNDIRGPLSDVLTSHADIFHNSTEIPYSNADQFPDSQPINEIVAGLSVLFPEASGLALRISDRQEGRLTELPRRKLKGTLPYDKYRSRVLDKVDAAFQEAQKDGLSPKQLLEQHPVIVCELSDNDGLPEYFILQGHYAVRRAGVATQQINTMPVEVFSPEKLANMLNERNMTQNDGTVTGKFIEFTLRMKNRITEESFAYTRQSRYMKGPDNFGRIAASDRNTKDERR